MNLKWTVHKIQNWTVFKDESRLSKRLKLNGSEFKNDGHFRKFYNEEFR